MPTDAEVEAAMKAVIPLVRGYGTYDEIARAALEAAERVRDMRKEMEQAHATDGR